MRANKKAQRNRNQFFSAKQQSEQAKAAEWFQTTCQFHYELEQMIRDSLLTITQSDSETNLLQNFIDERNATRKLHANEDLSGVFASIMKAQPYALEIVEHLKGGTITFTLVEGV